MSKGFGEISSNHLEVKQGEFWHWYSLITKLLIKVVPRRYVKPLIELEFIDNHDIHVTKSVV